MQNALAVIEVVIFTLNEGVSHDQIKQAAHGIDAELKQTKGFISRNFVHDHKGQWVDIVYWENMEAATKASEALMKSPTAGAYFSLINQQTMNMMHLSE